MADDPKPPEPPPPPAPGSHVITVPKGTLTGAGKR